MRNGQHLQKKASKNGNSARNFPIKSGWCEYNAVHGEYAENFQCLWHAQDQRQIRFHIHGVD